MSVNCPGCGLYDYACICAQNRARADQQDFVPAPDDPGSAYLLDRYTTIHRGKPKAELVARRSECITRAAELQGYDRLTQAQRNECNELAAEQLTIDELITEADIAVRAERIEHLRRVAMDPANLEAGSVGGEIRGPGLVKGLGDRVETAGETLQRMRSNPWQSADGPVNRADTAAGLITRAHVHWRAWKLS